jgi:hypothetical protein
MKFASLIRARWLPLVLAPVLALAALEASAELSTKPGEYGKNLLMDVVLPPSQLDKFAAFLAAKSDPNAPDSADWVGESMVANSATNPYTLVISVDGTARADGDVSTVWQAGWKLEDGMGKYSFGPTLSKAGVKAGEHVTITRAAPPSRFDRDKNVAPALNLVRASNITIDHVQVQLWSGFGKPTPMQWLMSYWWLVFGAVMLGVTLVFRKL